MSRVLLGLRFAKQDGPQLFVLYAFVLPSAVLVLLGLNLSGHRAKMMALENHGSYVSHCKSLQVTVSLVDVLHQQRNFCMFFTI